MGSSKFVFRYKIVSFAFLAGAISLAVDCSVDLCYGQALWAGWFKPEAARMEHRGQIVGRL